MALTLEALLQDTVARGGSDLHLVHGCPPCQRIAGDITAMAAPAVDSNTISALVAPYLSPHHAKQFEAEGRLNVAFTVPSLGRFRMNLCKAQGTVGASVRAIPTKTYPLSALGLPPIVGSLTQKNRGIIFITGSTGTGK
ncbi:MAG: pilus retraction protein PilT, partial [Elusimicrobia bacterium]